MEVLTEHGSSPTLGRFLLFETRELCGLRDLPSLSTHFALFTAFDQSDVSTNEMREILRILLRKGLAYACCWGEDCERWHDAIDNERAIFDLKNFGSTESHDVVMTTWHEGEPLTDALFFFGRLALPTSRYAEECIDYVIACSPNYTDVVRDAFRREPLPKNL